MKEQETTHKDNKIFMPMFVCTVYSCINCKTKKFKLKSFLRTPCGSAKIKKWRTSQWHELRSKKSGARPALSISSYRRAVDLHSFPVFANPVPAVFLNADQDPATKTS